MNINTKVNFNHEDADMFIAMGIDLERFLKIQEFVVDLISEEHPKNSQIVETILQKFDRLDEIIAASIVLGKLIENPEKLLKFKLLDVLLKKYKGASSSIDYFMQEMNCKSCDKKEGCELYALGIGCSDTSEMSKDEKGFLNSMDEIFKTFTKKKP